MITGELDAGTHQGPPANPGVWRDNYTIGDVDVLSRPAMSRKAGMPRSTDRPRRVWSAPDLGALIVMAGSYGIETLGHLHADHAG
ncbi:hypothetical protein SSP24_56380 [Streptomyces spinoverrucosus]|uniref:Uncharacterized protein n=1 Tax=Streptomyces spinoverrucosus TaxID=284043 RepID=A0A4Y3VN41_9ACTN|nr:hypothetical protein [Streptomyces spinoverrucosus]GEC07983.1 hypothetical protein SSP24_56380 [Streptomyces spinoverrucosus]GHB89343.1 hypothetical protein GCM10010397_71820 [Streptomyces spinoverrucosus]